MRLFGSSGIRTLFNRDLLDTAFKVGLAVGRLHKNVVVGRDTRTSGDAMKHAVTAGLLAAGAQAADAGIAPTPTVAYAAREFDAGIMITASHNPPEYNGLKLLNPDGSSFDTAQQEQMEALLTGPDLPAAAWQEVKTGSVYSGAIEKHIGAIAAYFPADLGIKVVVDAGCGAGAEVTPRLMKRLGCEVVPLHCDNSGFFPRGIEPSEENLKELCDKVKETGASVGIAHDGDADRMMAVDEKGRYISGDKMLAILAGAAGAKDIVTTLDATMAIDELGMKVRRTKIGDTWVSEELRKGGDFGGETSGAWIFPALSLCPDGIYAAAQIAALAASSSLSALANAVPVYFLLRGSMSSRGIMMSRLESELLRTRPLQVSRIDGMKLDYTDGWVLVRPSGTEPKIRLTAEARTQAALSRLYQQAILAVENSLDIGVKTS